MPSFLRSLLPGILLIFILLHNPAEAQDSIRPFPDSLRIHYFTETDFANHNFRAEEVDTSLRNFQKYNPVRQQGMYFADLGCIGLAAHDLEFTPDPEFGFQLGLHAFDRYIYHKKRIPYYINPKPYSQIFYVMGRYREQNFSIGHNQNIGKNLHVGAQFRVTSSFGDFQRQAVNHSNFYFNASFFTPNRRYGIIASYVGNSLTAEENGGITNDSIFENRVEEDTKRIEVNLLEAENSWKEGSASLSQYYLLSKKELKENDSVPLRNIQKVFSPGRLFHSFHYTKQKLTYEDLNPDSLFYPNFYFDSASTNDGLVYKQIDNTFGWTNSVDITSPFTLIFSVKHLYGKYDEKVLDSNIYEYSTNQLIYNGSVTIRPIPSLTIYGEASLINGDYNNGDHRFMAYARKSITLKSGRESVLLAKGLYSRQMAPWFYSHYQSNHFIWENNFDRTGIINLALEAKHDDLNLTFNYFLVSDWVYLGADMLPKQSEKDVSIINGSLNYYKRFYKFDVNLGALYHYVSDPDIIVIPDIMGTLSMYFVQDLFKKALRTQLGFDLYYTSKNTGNAYMPATRSFYLQDEKELSQLFIADAVFKFQVKTARFFLKYIHVNSLFGKREYYRTLHYPVQEASFKFGISWIFHD